MKKYKRHILVLTVTLAAFFPVLCRCDNSWGWASIENVDVGGEAGTNPYLASFGTHQYLNEKAYEELQKHPAFPEDFPSLAEIQEYSGIDSNEKGKGPDNLQNTKSSWHYYNPVTEKGDAPQTVKKYYEYLTGNLYEEIESQNEFTWEVSPPARNAAYLAHFIQDMTCGFHVLGMPGDKVNQYQPEETDVTGNYRTFSRAEWLALFQIYSDDKNSQIGHINWFDPNYYDGFPLYTEGSSHVLYEGLVEILFKKEGGLSSDWVKEKAADQGFISQDWYNTNPIDQFAKTLALWTRLKLVSSDPSIYFDTIKFQKELPDVMKNMAYSLLWEGNTVSDTIDDVYKFAKNHISIPYDDWWTAIQATYSAWRASFSAIRIRGDYNVKLVKEKDTPDTWKIKFDVVNLEPQSSAKNVKAKFFLDGENGISGEHYVGDLGEYDENKDGWYASDREFTQVIRSEDPKQDFRPLCIRLSGNLSVPDAEKSSWSGLLIDIGLEAKRLPDFTKTKTDVQDAEPYLKNRLELPYKIKKVKNIEHPDLKGIVKTQKPDAGYVNPEQEVILEVYDDFLVDVPNCVGQQTHIAIQLIVKSGLTPHVEEVETSDSRYKNGVVFEQSLKYKDKVPLKTDIKIKVARIKETPETEPLQVIEDPGDEVVGTNLGLFGSTETTDEVRQKLSRIEITPKIARLRVGEFVEFKATAYDQNGLPLTTSFLEDYSFLWGTVDSLCVYVEGNKMRAIATALEEGTYQIDFWGGNFDASADIVIQGTVDRYSGFYDTETADSSVGFGQKSKDFTTKKVVPTTKNYQSYTQDLEAQERARQEQIERNQEAYEMREKALNDFADSMRNIFGGGSGSGSTGDGQTGSGGTGTGGAGGASGGEIVCPDGTLSILGVCYED